MGVVNTDGRKWGRRQRSRVAATVLQKAVKVGRCAQRVQGPCWTVTEALLSATHKGQARESQKECNQFRSK